MRIHHLVCDDLAQLADLLTLNSNLVNQLVNRIHFVVWDILLWVDGFGQREDHEEQDSKTLHHLLRQRSEALEDFLSGRHGHLTRVDQVLGVLESVCLMRQKRLLHWIQIPHTNLTCRS